jgi:putative membrane protein
MASRIRLVRVVSPGLLLAAVMTAVTIWLFLTNQLSLYINPHYNVFALLMAGLSVVGIGASSFSHHSHQEPLRMKTLSIALGLVACVLVCSFLVLKPASLSSSTALQRGINSGGLDLTTLTTDISGFGATNYAQFDIRDWASILGQTSNISFYNGKTANLLGFVSPTTSNSPTVFMVSRFYITCCAMDAQPYGVPIYLPHWSSSYPTNSWVSVTGAFRINPDTASAQHIVLVPSKINAVPEPQDPYEH